MCRLVNRSGLRLSYWTRSADGNSTVHVLDTWEESPLLVDPVEHNIVLAETQQQVTIPRVFLLLRSVISYTREPSMKKASRWFLVQVIGRTICMQFEGGLAANCDVMVDKVRTPSLLSHSLNGRLPLQLPNILAVTDFLCSSLPDSVSY